MCADDVPRRLCRDPMESLLESIEVCVGRDKRPRGDLWRGRIQRLKDRDSTVMHAE